VTLARLPRMALNTSSQKRGLTRAKTFVSRPQLPLPAERVHRDERYVLCAPSSTERCSGQLVLSRCLSVSSLQQDTWSFDPQSVVTVRLVTAKQNSRSSVQKETTRRALLQRPKIVTPLCLPQEEPASTKLARTPRKTLLVAEKPDVVLITRSCFVF
jgi:hypothetical protein